MVVGKNGAVNEKKPSVCIYSACLSPPFLSFTCDWSGEACTDSESPAVTSPVSVCLIYRQNERLISSCSCTFIKKKGGNEGNMAFNGGQKRKKRVLAFFSMQYKAPLFGSGESLWKIFRLYKPRALFTLFLLNTAIFSSRWGRQECLLGVMRAFCKYRQQDLLWCNHINDNL